MGLPARLFDEFTEDTGIRLLRRHRRAIGRELAKRPPLVLIAGGKAPGAGAAGRAAGGKDAPPPVPPDVQTNIRRDFREYCRRVLKKEPHPYQLYFAAAIIYAFRVELHGEIGLAPVYEWPDVQNLTAEQKARIDDHRKIAAVQPRQSGKSETLAMLVPYLITVLPKFRAGVYAPTEDQASKYIFKRVRDSLEYNPAYQGRFKALNALDLELFGHEEVLPPASRASGGYFIARSASPTANIEGETLHLAIIDEAQDVGNMKANKSIFPMLASTNGVLVKIGTVSFTRNHFYECLEGRTKDTWVQIVITHEEVEACNPAWKEFKRRFIAEEGLHSDLVQTQIFLKWMLQRGQFITDDELEALYDHGKELVPYQKGGYQFAGIDVAKTRDRTVVTVVEIYPDRQIDGFVPCRLLAWKTMQGVDYVAQFTDIRDWFDTCYNILGVCIDTTGDRGGLAEQFKTTRYRVEPFTYTEPAKSEGYTWLQTIIKTSVAKVKAGATADRILTIPAGPETQETAEFKLFEAEALDLQKEYSTRYLRVHHPEGDGYTDDFWDSLMQAVWVACRGIIPLDLSQLEKLANTEAAQVAQELWGENAGPRRRRRGAGQNVDQYMGDDLEAPE